MLILRLLKYYISQSCVFKSLKSINLAKLSLILLALYLAGCAAVATQVVSSILTHSADRIINDAYDAKLREEDRTRKLPDTHPDQYWVAMQNSGFNTITPQVENIPFEPLNASQIDSSPVDTTQANTTQPIIEPLAVVAELANVEVWNLLIGEEKNTVFENARLGGAMQLPPLSEWKSWQVALGGLMSDNLIKTTGEISKKRPIVFLIPPNFGRVTSGQQLIVELARQGEVNIARYALPEITAVLSRSP